MRAVFDPNVLVSSLLSPRGIPGRLAARWRAGDFDLVVSLKLLAELENTLEYPKLRERVSPDDAVTLVAFLRERGASLADPADPPRRSRDPADDYLLALAEAAGAHLVSGDRDLLQLAGEFPVLSPRDFFALLDRAEDAGL